jgi:hypothetical protein
MSSFLLYVYKIGNQNTFYYPVLIGSREQNNMAELNARIPCRSETRDEIRALKRDSERYEDVLQRLLNEARGND